MITNFKNPTSTLTFVVGVECECVPFIKRQARYNMLPQMRRAADVKVINRASKYNYFAPLFIMAILHFSFKYQTLITPQLKKKLHLQL